MLDRSTGGYVVDPINIAEYEALAAERLEPMVWDYYRSGSDDEQTLRANRDAFGRIQLRPRVLVDVSHVSLETTVLGVAVRMPLLVAPTAYHGLAHPEGECETARGVGAAGSLMIVSTMSNRSLEEVAAATDGPLWFQLYVYRDRQRLRASRAPGGGCGLSRARADGRHSASWPTRARHPQRLWPASPPAYGQLRGRRPRAARSGAGRVWPGGVCQCAAR